MGRVSWGEARQNCFYRNVPIKDCHEKFIVRLLLLAIPTTDLPLRVPEVLYENVATAVAGFRIGHCR